MTKATHGGARPGSGPKPTDVSVSRIVTLRAQGLSWAEIGRRFGLGWWVVKRAHDREAKKKDQNNA